MVAIAVAFAITALPHRERYMLDERRRLKETEV
jgi:hypothetical protein